MPSSLGGPAGLLSKIKAVLGTRILCELSHLPLWLGVNQFSVPTHSHRQVNQLSHPLPPPLGDFILFFHP